MAETGLPLTVRFDRLGRETASISEWSIDSNYLVSTDGFSFTYADQNRANLRGLECQPVTLVVGEAPQLVGRIDATERGQSYAVSCEGRDYIADIVECHVDPKLAVKEGMTLQQAVQLACSPCGITIVLGDASVVRNIRTGKRKGRTKPADFLELSLQDLKPEGEVGIYDYINRLAVRHGGTIQPTLARNELLIQAPNYDQEPSAFLRRSLDPGGTNRIQSGSARRDFGSFPTYTICRGLVGPSALEEKSSTNATSKEESAGLTPETAAVSVKGRRVPAPGGPDADGQLYRLLSIHDRQARNRQQANALAFRGIWDRMKDTLTYRCTVSGHSDPDTGAIYSVDTIVDVQDEVADVTERLWVYRRQLRYTQQGGAETELECWRIGAYLLAVNE